MSAEGRPLTTDEASDAQSLEDILRQMTLDQFTSFPSIVDHISRHFVNLHPDERRYILTGLRHGIIASYQQTHLESLPLGHPFEEETKSMFLENYAKLSNIDSAYLPLYFDVQRWYSGSVGDRRKCSPLEYLDNHMQFMFYFKEIMSTESVDLDEVQFSSEFPSEEVEPHVRDISRFVINLYGLNCYPRPSAVYMILRLRNVHLAFSITREARNVLNIDELNDFESALEESTQIITENGYRYDKNMSAEALRKLTEIAEPHEQLMQLLMNIPWYHLEESD